MLSGNVLAQASPTVRSYQAKGSSRAECIVVTLRTCETLREQ